MQWVGAVFCLAKQITALGWAFKIMQEDTWGSMQGGKERVKSGENEERIGKGLTLRACLSSCLPWRALHTHPLHHAQESPAPLCLVHPGYDLAHTSPGLDHCCRIHYWLKLRPWLVLGEDTAFPVASNTPSFLEEATEATHDYNSVYTESFFSEDYTNVTAVYRDWGTSPAQHLHGKWLYVPNKDLLFSCIEKFRGRSFKPITVP